MPKQLLIKPSEDWVPLYYRKQDGGVFDLRDKVLINNTGLLYDIESKRIKPPYQHVSNKCIEKNRIADPLSNAHWRANFHNIDVDGVIKKTVTIIVGRAVLCAFDPDGWAIGMTVDHINHKIHDNRIENLQWLTHYDNCKKMPAGWVPYYSKVNANAK